MSINEPKEILDILNKIDKTTKEQLDKAIQKVDEEES